MNPELETRIWAIHHYLAVSETRNPFVIAYNVLKLLLKGLGPHQAANCYLLQAQEKATALKSC